MRGHGSYEIKLVNRVLIARIIGAWNKEEGEQYFKELKRLVQGIIHEPWAMAVYLDQWELGTPGSDEVTVKLIKWLYAHNLQTVAEIYSPSLLKQKHVEKMVSSSEQVIHRQCFTQEQPAFEWLESQGFPTTSTD